MNRMAIGTMNTAQALRLDWGMKMTKKQWYEQEARDLARARDRHGRQKAKRYDARQLATLARQISKGMIASTDLATHGY